MIARSALLISIGIAAVAIVSAQSVRDRDPSWVVPDGTDSKVNPLRGRPETAAGGRKIFEQRCASCHGDDARGTDRAPDLVATDVQAQSDGALFWKISSGNTRAGMPSFSFLPEAQRWQVVLHLRSLVKPGTDLAFQGDDLGVPAKIRGNRPIRAGDFRTSAKNIAVSGINSGVYDGRSQWLHR